eukprot:352129-Chlamydomonas_euryale.AAC.9
MMACTLCYLVLRRNDGMCTARVGWVGIVPGPIDPPEKQDPFPCSVMIRSAGLQSLRFCVSRSAPSHPCGWRRVEL